MLRTAVPPRHFEQERLIHQCTPIEDGYAAETQHYDVEKAEVLQRARVWNDEDGCAAPIPSHKSGCATNVHQLRTAMSPRPQNYDMESGGAATMLATKLCFTTR